MQKSKTLSLLVCLVLMVLMSQTLWGQFVIKVNGTDGSGITDTLTLAVDPAGTAGFDSLSPTLREYEIPVAAKGLDFRVASNYPQDALGLGSYTSIHHFGLPTQTDSWKLQFNVDSGRTGFLLQWPAGLGSLGGHYWKLIPDPADVISFTPVDMTTSTSMSIPVADIESHTMFIVTGDNQVYRSFASSDIVNAMDFKGTKGKAEKRKPYGSEGTFTWTNTLPGIVAPDTIATDLHIEWNESIDDASLSISHSPNTHSFSDAPKNTKLDITFPDSIPHNGVVTIFARGNKGKPLQAKKWWWTINTVMWPPKVKNLPVDPSPGRLLLHMPNVDNIGEEIYTQNIAGFVAPYGLTIGDPVNRSGVDGKGKDIFKAVIHPKWKDVLKTLSDKTGPHTGPAACLDFLIGAPPKPIVKVQKSLPPGKHNNMLLAEAVTLKVNIGAGDGLKIEEGGTVFGDLKYVKQGGDPNVPAGTSVRAIADSSDQVMRCLSPSWGGSYEQWRVMLNRINGSFAGAFDTTSFGQSQAGKPAGGTVAKGTRPIVEVPFLYRTSFGVNLPPYTPPNIALLEARNQPDRYKLMQNYPNPFNPMTTIEFAIPEEGFVTMKVYNLLGQEVATLVDHELMDQGTNEVTFDASALASGVYYYRMMVNDGQFQQVKKMMLVK